MAKVSSCHLSGRLVINEWMNSSCLYWLSRWNVSFKKIFYWFINLLLNSKTTSASPSVSLADSWDNLKKAHFVLYWLWAIMSLLEVIVEGLRCWWQKDKLPFRSVLQVHSNACCTSKSGAAWRTWDKSWDVQGVFSLWWIFSAALYLPELIFFFSPFVAGLFHFTC